MKTPLTSFSNCDDRVIYRSGGVDSSLNSIKNVQLLVDLS